MSEYRLPLEMLYRWETELPDQVCMRQPFPGQGYREIRRRDMMAQVRSIAAALQKRGLPPKSQIAILSKNCAHWMMADWAIWMAGHVSVPVYPNLVESSVRAILEHSDSKLAFVGKLDDVNAYRSAVPDGVPCIAFPYHPVSGAEAWDAIVEATPPMPGRPSRQPDEVATIIYTSGTTGDPKGVMHSFRSLAVAGTETVRAVKLKPQMRFFSYLPMAHVAERIIVESASLYTAGVVSFVESLNSFSANVQSVQPEVFVAVPRLWQKFQSGVLAKIPQKRLSRLLGVPILSTIVRRKIQRGLGLRHAQIIITGGAPTPPALIEWFRSIGVHIQEAYGMTENFAYSHYNHRENIQVGTVGTPWPGVRTRISAEGEIQVASPCSFLGYYKQEGRRAESFDGEYLKTGDAGTIDEKGYLRITGRVKETFKTDKGKYVAPAPIEGRFAENTRIEAVCVMGSGLPSPIAIVTLVEPGPTSEIRDELLALMKRVNQSLDPHERLAKIIVIKGNWTTDNGFLTPTLKVKRRVVETKYAGLIPQWMQTREQVIFET